MDMSLARTSALIILGLFGVYKFTFGYLDGNSSDILIGGVFMCLGLNLIFLHPLVLFTSIGGMIFGYFYTNPWYIGFFSVLSVVTQILIIINAPHLIKGIRNLSNKDN